MIVEVHRVSTFNLQNLLGHDAPQEVLDLHKDCIPKSSVIWLGLADGVEAVATGLIPATVFSTEAYLWMIHTKLCEQHPIPFIRWSRKVIDEALDLFPSIVGLVHYDNASGQRWLEWLGAKIEYDVSWKHRHYGFRIRRWPLQQ